MPSQTVIRSLTPVLIVMALHGACLRAAEAKPDLPATAPAAANSDLKALEARAAEAIRRALPAVVAVNITRPTRVAGDPREHSESGASGVIIRPDGLILSQRHVSHVSRQTGQKDRDLAPGDRIEVALQDGRRLTAELLGSDPVRDLSL